MPWAAKSTACCPDPHLRSIVTDGTDLVTSVEVVPTGARQGDAALDLVRALRDDRPSSDALVTGSAAFLVDFNASLAERLPWAGLLVATATFVLLFLMTGSVLVPAKALVMNVLSLGASFGALVLVFGAGGGEVEGVAAEGFCAREGETLDVDLFDHLLGGGEAAVDCVY